MDKEKEIHGWGQRSEMLCKQLGVDPLESVKGCDELRPHLKKLFRDSGMSMELFIASVYENVEAMLLALRRSNERRS